MSYDFSYIPPKKALLPPPHMLLLRQNSFMSHSADFALGFCRPLFTLFANLEPNLQPQLHMKPFITNPPLTQNLQKTVEDDSYKLRTSSAEKSTNSPPATLGIPWDSLHKTRKPALGGGVTTWRWWKKHRLLRGLDESYQNDNFVRCIYIYWIQLCIIIIVTSYM